MAVGDHAAITDLAEHLGHKFVDVALIDTAMAHRSWCAEHPGHESNERLEFLGDAVLGWVTADIAYRAFPAMTEGQLTGIRKGVVNARALADIATELGLGSFVKLGKGEAAGGGADKASILADALEALIGAVYVDGGSAVAYRVVERLVATRVADVAERLDELDYKSTLQELVAARGDPAPVYELVETGPDHLKHFAATVIIGGEVLGAGEGRSKRAAEQAAAAVASKALVEIRRMIDPSAEDA